jgi:hypothetical protein
VINFVFLGKILKNFVTKYGRYLAKVDAPCKVVKEGALKSRLRGIASSEI